MSGIMDFQSELSLPCASVDRILVPGDIQADIEDLVKLVARRSKVTPRRARRMIEVAILEGGLKAVREAMG